METYNGHVRTPADAIILFEACRLGLLPRVQRRLSEKERQSIKSGSVFVWDEREAGMRRWTDGKSWSASRVSGSFLTYREMEGKRGGNGFTAPLAATRAGKTPDSTRGSDSDLELAGGDDGHDGYRYKPDGLMKQSFSITTSGGNHLHLISYYARSHPSAGGLCNPSNDPALRNIRPQKGMYPESTVQEQQNIPAVTRAPMVSAPYSTVPQMAGYARSGPPQQQMNTMQQFNSWAPQPQWHMPPNGNGGGYHSYGHYYGGHGHPVPNEHSPLSHSQSVENPTSEPQQAQHPLPHAYPYARSPGPQYDRSPRPNESLAPPPQHHRTSSTGSNHQQYRPYATERPPHSGPALQQAPYEQQAPPQQAYQHYSHHHSPYPQSDHSPYQPPPPQHYPNPYSHAQPSQQQQPYLPHRTHSQHQAATPPTSMIDPRLMAPSPLPQQQQQSQSTQSARAPSRTASSRTASPQTQTAPQESASAPKPAAQASTNTNGISNGGVQSQASTIPSIGSIMNGPPTTPSTSDNTNTNANADVKSDRSGSKSPAGNAAANGSNGNGNVKRDTRDTRDANASNGAHEMELPKEKLGFREDVRTVRMLDRQFRT